MFRRRTTEDSLPFSRDGGGYSSALKPTEMRALPKVTPLRALGWLWVASGILLAWWGTRFCAASREVSRLDCDAEGCRYYTSYRGIEEEIYVERSRLVAAELIKVKNGRILASGARREKKTKSSWALKWRAEDGRAVQKAFTLQGLSRRDSKAAVGDLSRYILRDVDSVKKELDQWGSALGIFMIVVGCIILIARLAVGNLESVGRVDKRKRGVTSRAGGRRRY